MTKRRAVSPLRWLAGIATIAVALASARAEAEPEGARRVVDRTVVRFYAPELGGVEQPRFVGERTLAFEARLEVIADSNEGLGDGYDERQIRAALDRHVSEEVLTNLARKLIAGSPPNLRPTLAELDQLKNELAAAFYERLGGQARVEAAAQAEQLGLDEVEAMLGRQAFAAWYVDRAVAPILQTPDAQLREVFRTVAHPYRNETFEKARSALKRWYLIERLFAVERSFLQGLRARVRVVVVR